jgi:hypothetical protein
MMIAMLIAFTIGGQNFERYEPMPNLATCWQSSRLRCAVRAGKVVVAPNCSRIAESSITRI